MEMVEDRLPEFEKRDVGPALDRLSPEQLHGLKYGTVKLATDGRVLFYSEREAELSGFLPTKALGQHWLVDVAPCMDSPAFRDGLADAATGRAVDAYFSDLPNFRDPREKLEVRLVSSSVPQVCWLLVRRL